MYYLTVDGNHESGRTNGLGKPYNVMHQLKSSKAELDGVEGTMYYLATSQESFLANDITGGDVSRAHTTPIGLPTALKDIFLSRTPLCLLIWYPFSSLLLPSWSSSLLQVLGSIFYRAMC